MLLVLDANAVIGLCKGKIFELLKHNGQQVMIAPATYEEVVTKGQGRPGSNELEAAVGQWVEVKDPALLSMAEFSQVQNQRDREVLALAYELRPNFLVTGDWPMVRVARSRGLMVLSVLDLLVIAKLDGWLPAIRPVVETMLARNFGISPDVYQQALRRTGE